MTFELNRIRVEHKDYFSRKMFFDMEVRIDEYNVLEYVYLNCETSFGSRCVHDIFEFKDLQWVYYIELVNGNVTDLSELNINYETFKNNDIITVTFDFPKVNNNYDDAFYNFNLTIHYNTTTKKVKSVDIQSDDKKLYIVT